MSEAERIRWQESPLGMIDGHVGAVEACLFSIWQPPQASGEWVLTTQLPGMEGVRVYGDDPGDLKPEAERLLAKFTSSLGAVFPESVLELADGWDAASRKVTAMLAEAGMPEAVEAAGTPAAGHPRAADLREVITKALLGEAPDGKGGDGG